MAYKLEYLDQLVKAAAPGSQPGHFTLSEMDITRILREALEETDKIKVQLVQEVFSFTKEKEIEVYIKNYQLGCTHLLDRLYSQEQQLTAAQTAATDFYQQFYLLILSLLSFIEERFSKYFDRLEKIPDVYLALAKKELQQKQAGLQEQLENTGEVFITTRLLERMHSFVNGATGRTITFRDLMFYKELIKELADLQQWNKQAGIFSGLQQLLIYLNYNAKEFINGMVNKIAGELQGIVDLNDRIDRVLLYSKSLNQLQLKPDSGLLPAHPAVKTQLGNWLAEELQYQDRKLAGLNTGKNAATGHAATKNKVVCKVPVDQLGIFFRAASELQLIVSPHQKMLFEQIVPWLSTTYKMDLSADSMRSKSYAPEKKDIEAVKDFLMQLFRQVTQY